MIDLRAEATDEEYRERARRLALMLKQRPERHDQSLYLTEEEQNECGTAGCIAGWASVLVTEAAAIDAQGVMTWDTTRALYREPARGGFGYEETAVRYLDLGWDVADALFDGEQDEADAVAFLALIAEGKVDRHALVDDSELTSDFRDRLIEAATT